MSNGKPQDIENLRWEYREVASSHRFYVGLRFIIAAFTATLQSALLTFYNQATESVRRAGEGRLQGAPESHSGIDPISIAIVGLTTMAAIFFMEQRNIARIRIMVTRAVELEFKLGLGDGQYGRFHEPDKISLFTYTRSLMIIYFLIGGLWLVLITPRLLVYFYERIF